MKKTLSIIIAIMLMLGMLATSVNAASEDISLYGFRNTDEKGGSYAFLSIMPNDPAKAAVLSEQKDEAEIYCGAFFGGNIYAVDENGVLYKIDTGKFNRTEIGTVIEDTSVYRPVEMSYDILSGKMYLLCIELGNNNSNVLYTVDIKNASTVYQCHIIGAAKLLGLTFNGSGVLYGIGETGMLYNIDVHSGRAKTIGDTGYEGSYIQSACYNRTQNLIYWANYNNGEGTLLSVDPVSAQATELGKIGKNCEISALCMSSDAYEITVIAEEGGIAYINGPSYYNAGETAAFTAEVTNGYTFGGWKVSGGTLSNTNELSSTVVMPSGDITVKAFFLPKKLYQERTLYSENAKITLSGKKIYYNAQFTATDWQESEESYALLTEAMGNKRTLLRANNLIFKAFATEEVQTHKNKVTVSIPIPESYEENKVNVFLCNGESISKINARVKDNQITVKIDNAESIAVTSYKGVSFIAVLLLIILIGALGFFIYLYRGLIIKSLKKKLSQIKLPKKKKSLPEKSEEIIAAIDEQDLNSSRYDI